MKGKAVWGVWPLMLSVLAVLSGCERARWHNTEGMVWHTTYHITYKAESNLDDSILAVMNRVEMSLSPFAENSLVSAVNRGEDVEADTLLRRILAASQMVNRQSGGAFDPTVAPLVNLWGYGYKSTGVEPTAEAVDSLLALVGIADCSLDAQGHVVKKHPDTEFNFSAITKGYGCDLVGEMLRRNGCDDYMVEIGGEIALSGLSPRGREWRIMVDAPIECDTAVVHERMAVMELTGKGVATSGNYRNYRDTPEGRTWHTISPVNGRPAVTDLLSATVVAPTCMLADAYATACMARNASEALTMIESLDGVEALVVTRDSVYRTPGFPRVM
ncbi:MAG: FAD:protein FMN transferase [Duncaniella sp.]|nr:FAD:protein FMN transferase [Duncaniella sp.]